MSASVAVSCLRKTPNSSALISRARQLARTSGDWSTRI